MCNKAEFGHGFIVPGDHKYDFDGMGVITVYDLTRQQGGMCVKNETLKDGGCGGWEGDIDEENRKITAFDIVKGTKKEYSFPKE